MLRDNLRFIEAHLYLQYELGEYKPKRKEFQAHYSQKFKFINLTGDLEVSSTDRQGLGIVELLLDIVFDLLRENKNEKVSSLKKEVIERLDAIEKYFQRHTDLEGYERLIAYYRLIRLGIKHNWKSASIEKEAPPFYEVLDGEYEIFSSQRFDVEYLPYKDQFGGIVKSLAKR
jgi:hypothetical protein